MTPRERSYLSRKKDKTPNNLRYALISESDLFERLMALNSGEVVTQRDFYWADKNLKETIGIIPSGEPITITISPYSHTRNSNLQNGQLN